MVYSNNKLHADLFFTAAKAIQLYLIGSTSRFLTFSRRRIYSCKNQNKAKNSRNAHAGMATSPTATAYKTHSQLIRHWDTQWMFLLTKLYNEFCFVLMQSPNVSLWIQCHRLLWTLFKGHVWTWLKISAVDSATFPQIYFLSSLCSCWTW